MVYYNELDRKKAAWLRELIKVNAIAKGEVDERSITDVQPGDLDGFDQCHFFAGIGIWSYALRCAGWPDEAQAWTGSCPCQPFSVAGKGEGTEDRRHLWPAWFRLIRERKPGVVFGEQVSSPDALAWLDIVFDDMEGSAYTIGAADLCAPGVGAPHIRNRTFFVGDAPDANGGGGIWSKEEGTRPDGIRRRGSGESGTSCQLADTESGRFGIERDDSIQGNSGHVNGCSESNGMGNTHETGSQRRSQRGSSGSKRAFGSASVAGSMANAERKSGCSKYEQEPRIGSRRGSASIYVAGFGGSGEEYRRGPVNGFWEDAVWIPCRSEREGEEGRYRPIESCSFPLAYGTPQRVGRLRGYGDGIVAPLAQAFIECYIEECDIVFA